MHQKLQKVETINAPQAIGPYSQAVRAGSFLFVSGQIPLDPITGKLAGVTIESQAEQVFKNLEGILKNQNLTFENVAKVDIFLKNLSDFQTVNELYAQKFSFSIKPARATVEVSRLPMDVLIEISCIAFFG